MHRLFRAGSLTEAYLVCGLLAQEQISARVLNEHASGAAGELPLTEVGPEVWIAESANLARAREIVAGYERSRSAAGSRRCAACGESSPANFELCWRCGQPLLPANP